MTEDLDTGAWLPLGRFAAWLDGSAAAWALSEWAAVAAADSAAVLCVTCCLMIARARERGRCRVGRAAGCRAT